MARSFEATLSEVERLSPPSGAPPAVGCALPDAPQDGGHHSLWELAAEWAPEADPPPPPEPAPAPPAAPPPSARAEDVASELKLDALLSPADVARARRRFMWDNHPDRGHAHGPDLANRRVALANMLLDRALETLKRAAKR